MNKQTIIGLLVLLVIVTPVLSDYPTLKPYVNDFANLLTAEEEVLLNHLCTEIEKNTTVEIAVVTVKTTNGQDRIRYANELGEKSGVGKKATDNGVVVLWSQANEKGGAIATGRGIEATLNDAKTGRIGRASREYFDEEQYAKGFEYIVNEIGREVGYGQQVEQTGDEITEADVFAFFIILIVIIVIIGVLFFIISESGGGGSSWIGTGIGSGGGWGGGGFGGGSFGGGGSGF